MRFIDSNIFIYVLIQSPKDVYETCRRILKRIENGEQTIVSTSVIQEVIDWLEYNNRKKEVETFVKAVNSYLKLRKVSNTWKDFIGALDDAQKYEIDFVDALTLQTMKRHKIKEIYTNNRDFEKIEWVKRILE